MAPKIPPLAACNTRPPIIAKNVCAIALMANPIIINTRLTIYKRLVDTLLIKNADNGIIIALAKAKPLVTHCPIPSDTFKSFVICGNAITIAVANKDAEKEVIIKFKKIKVRLRLDIIILHKNRLYKIYIFYFTPVIHLVQTNLSDTKKINIQFSFVSLISLNLIIFQSTTELNYLMSILSQGLQ